MITLNLNMMASYGGRQIGKENLQKQAGQLIEWNESIPDSSTDLLVAASFKYTKLEAIILISDQDMTIETNDGTTPDDTINLQANVPFLWIKDYATEIANPFSADVTAFYVTQNSGQAAQLQGFALVDPT